MNHGKADAVCVRATYIGPALSPSVEPPPALHEGAEVRDYVRNEEIAEN